MKCANCETKITFWKSLRQQNPFRYRCPRCKTKHRVSAPYIKTLVAILGSLSLALGFALAAGFDTFGPDFTLPALGFLIGFLVVAELFWYRYITRKGKLLRLDSPGHQDGLGSRERSGERVGTDVWRRAGSTRGTMSVMETNEPEKSVESEAAQRSRFSKRDFFIGLAAGIVLSAGVAAAIGATVALGTFLAPMFEQKYGAEEHQHEDPSFSSLGDRLSDAQSERNGNHDTFAVILNGDNAPRHLNNVSRAYSTLAANGYASENIFVLSYQDTSEPTDDESEEPEGEESEGEKREERKDDDSEKPGFMTHAPTYGNIEMLFEEFLQKVIDEKDYLTIYVTGHGTHKGRTSEVSIMKVYDEYNGRGYSSATLSEVELAHFLEGMDPAQTVLIFDQCHSGFGDDFPIDDFLVVSRSTVTETGTCKHFAERFFDLLNPEEQGRRMSIGEAFEATLRLDQDYRDGLYTPSIKGPLKGADDEVFLSK